MEPRIVQLVPAPLGWRAVFVERDGYSVVPVVAFALVEAVEKDGSVSRWVEAISSDTPWEGWFAEASFFDSFAGLLMPGEPDEAAHELVEEWREQEKKRRRRVS